MNAGKQISTFKRGLCLQAAVSLLFFLVLSAPHRVHHFFDQFASHQPTDLATAQSHDHGESRHENNPSVPVPASQHNDCVVLTATQNAHALAASSFALTIFTAEVEHTHKHSSHSAFSFNPSPRSQRAPPLV
ncbi:MAG: hypothetical protein ACREPG_08830 [Candidatus Binatia bacterium]